MVDSPLTLSIDGQDYAAHRARARFAMGELFTVAVEGLAPQGTKPEDLLGKAATVKLAAAQDGAQLPVHGIVVEVEIAPNVAHNAARPDDLRVVVAPEVFALDVGQDCYVFQKMSVPDVLKDVLQSAGIAADHFELRLGSYSKRTYVAQYRESDWAFIARLCADEGIFWWFELEDDVTKLVFSDDSSSAPAMPGGAAIPTRADAGLVGAGEAVFDLICAVALTSDAVRMVDYEPKTPAVKLDGSSKANGGALEIYDWPGGFSLDADGKTRAQRRLESLRARRTTLTGRTNGVRVRVGAKLEPSDHPLAAINRAWLCTAIDCDVDHRHGAAAGFRGRFTAIPADVPFRLEPRRTWRECGGPQTAVVSGPKGQEIHSDDAGGVRAQFHWDRVGKKDENASTFMRVGQVPLGGSMIMPRIGWEVLVEHREGNVDRPFVDAHLYEGEHTVPYALPANKTRTAWQTATTPGDGTTNEIRFEDKAGNEEIFVNSSKDTKIVVGNDKTSAVTNNHKYTIGVNEDVSIGSKHALQVDADQTVSIGASETLSVSSKRALTVKGSLNSTIGASRTATVVVGQGLTVEGGRTATVGANMMSIAGQKVSRSSLGSFSATIGGAWISVAGKDASDTVGGAASETVGAARILLSGSDMNLGVKGALAETVGGACIQLAGGKLTEDATSTLAITVGGAFIGNGAKVVIEASSEISLLCGGSSIKVTSGCIEIKSPSLASPGAIFHKTGGNIHHNP